MRTSLALATVLSCLAFAVPAGAASIASLPVTTNGAVEAGASPGGKGYLGGSFQYVGPVTGPGATLGQASARPLGGSAIVQGGSVNIAISDGAGGFYLGGTFRRVGGVERNRIAHVLASGALDTTFDANADGPVVSLALAGGTLYVGGDFTAIGDRLRTRIAAVSATTGTATTWNPGSTQPVMALAVSGTVVYAGLFTTLSTTIGGATRTGLAALDTTVDTNNATAWNHTLGGSTAPIVRDLLVSGTTVYVAGAFASVDGQTRNGLAAIDTSPAITTPTAWNPNVTSGGVPVVKSIALSGTKLYAAGFFGGAGGQSRQGLAELDT